MFKRRKELQDAITTKLEFHRHNSENHGFVIKSLSRASQKHIEKLEFRNWPLFRLKLFLTQ